MGSFRDHVPSTPGWLHHHNSYNLKKRLLKSNIRVYTYIYLYKYMYVYIYIYVDKIYVYIYIYISTYCTLQASCAIRPSADVCMQLPPAKSVLGTLGHRRITKRIWAVFWLAV